MHGDKEQEYKLIEHDDYWVIPLSERAVSKLIIGYELTIEFLGPQHEEITIWMGKTYLKVNGMEYKLSAQEPSKLGPLLHVMRNTVQSALAHKNGKLEIDFQDGIKLWVLPLSETESWGITGRRGLRVVSMPGGDLAIWQADPDDTSK